MTYREEIGESLVKIWCCEFLELWGTLHENVLAVATDRGVLELESRVLAENVDESLELHRAGYFDRVGLGAACWAILSLHVLERVREETVVAHVHHVVVEIARDVGGDLEGFVGTNSRYECIGACNSGDDVLDHALEEKDC